MSFAIGDVRIETPALLAPMAGITDLPFRRLIARFGAGLVVSEMVASREMVEAKRSMRARAAVEIADDASDAAVASVQIAGRDAYWMAEAARLCVDGGARIIDINMGCPAKKVVNGLAGSALMREPGFALSLIEAVVDAVEVPVTLKMRLGWCETEMNAPQIARRAEAAGVRMIAVHGRTRQQFYKGAADWAAIRAVTEAVSIPVIANGDILDAADARRAMALSGAAGVMIGRGARGAPWKLARIGAELRGAPAPTAPDAPALRDLMLEHYDEMLRAYGRELGVRCARKHLCWYLERVVGGRNIRDALIRLTEPEAVRAQIRDGFARLIDEAAPGGLACAA